MGTRRAAIGTPVAIGAGIAFLVGAVAIAMIFDSPVSVIILAVLVLLAFGFVRYSSR